MVHAARAGWDFGHTVLASFAVLIAICIVAIGITIEHARPSEYGKPAHGAAKKSVPARTDANGNAHERAR